MRQFKHTFFKPRVGLDYEKGFSTPQSNESHRTMILGAYHVCSDDQFTCEHKAKCCSKDGIRKMDTECPIYKELLKKEDFRDYAEYYVLSNSDTIEMDSYLEKEDIAYPTYNEFTRKMLGRKSGFISCEDRSSLWERVIFHNYLQHYVNRKAPVPYTTERTPHTLSNAKALSGEMLYKAAIPSLKEVLEAYIPLYIYVWSDSVKECLIANLKEIPSLKYEGEIDFDLTTVRVYLFSYKRQKESLPFPVVNDTTLKETHLVRNKNLIIEGTTIEGLLAEFREGQCIYDFYEKKNCNPPSVKWFHDACLIFKSLMEMNYLDYSEDKNVFMFHQERGTSYAKRLMFTLVIDRLNITWNDLYSFVYGNPTLGNAQPPNKKTKKIETIEKIADYFYIIIFNEDVPNDHPLKNLIVPQKP